MHLGRAVCVGGAPVCHVLTLICPDRMRAWVDLSLMALTFLLTIIWNVEVGIAVSVIVSLLLVVHRSSKTRMTILASTT